MPKEKIPLPKDLIEQVGEFKRSLKDVEKELRQIDRQAAKVIKKGGALDAATAARRGELGARRSYLTSMIDEQSAQLAFNKRIDRWTRKKTAALGPKVGAEDVGKARDLMNLARGDLSVAAMASSGEFLQKMRQQGLRKGVGQFAKAAPEGIAQLFGLGQMGAVLWPLAWGAFALNQFKGAHKLGEELGKKTGAVDKQINQLIGDPGRRRQIRDALVKAADVGVQGTFKDRMLKSLEQRGKMQNLLAGALESPDVAAEVLKRSGIEVAPTGEEVEAVLEQLGAEGLLDEALGLIDIERRGRDIIRKRQAEVFANDAQMAGRFHDRARMFERLEQARIDEGPKGW